MTMTAPLWFLLVVLLVATIAGATAAVTGFGIGSLLTPLLATRVGMQTAIAAVSIPHVVATALRAWRLRAHVDGAVLRSFGLWSAAGGLVGALLYTRTASRTLTVILALLLLLTAVAALTDWLRRLHQEGPAASALGLTSGLFGGLAGNQGGLRSAALLGFPLSPLAFVATATATGLMVDAARMPVYLWRSGRALAPLSAQIAVALAGVVAGTLLGERALLGLSRDSFRRIVAVIVAALGLWLLWRAGIST